VDPFNKPFFFKSNQNFAQLTPGCWTSHDDRGGAHAHDDHGLDGLHDGDHAGVPDHGGDHIGRWGHDRAEVQCHKTVFRCHRCRGRIS
jgi:hypothetical protein